MKNIDYTVSLAQLDAISLRTWIARLLDRTGRSDTSDDLFSIPFPQCGSLIEAHDYEEEWLIATYRNDLREGVCRAAIARAVSELLLTQCRNTGITNAIQVTGVLIYVAGQCDIIEVTPLLRLWTARSQFSPNDTMQIRQRNVSIRAMIWHTLYWWHSTEGLLQDIVDDLRHLECWYLLQNPGRTSRRYCSRLTLSAHPYT